MAVQQYSCLLDDMIDLEQWTVQDVIKIENHISSGTCPKAHPPVKDLAREEGGCLLRACHGGDLEAVKKIVQDWEADVNSTVTHFLTLYISNHLETGSYTLIETMLSGVSPLFVAALGSHVEVVRYLVSMGADVSAKTSEENEDPFAGITPLHGAMLYLYGTVANRYVETIRVLLESKADLHALSSDGTPTWIFGTIGFSTASMDPLLPRLCRHCLSYVNAISLLVEHGMRLDEKCSTLDRTLMHHLSSQALVFCTGPSTDIECFDHQVKVLNLILEKGADPLVRDKHGLTPIMVAAIGNNEDFPNMSVLKILVERNDIPNKNKIEALEVATAVLIGHGPHSPHLDYCLSRSQNLRIIEGTTSIPKIPSVGRAVEWDPPFNLDYVQQRSSLERQMQSILTRLRIFSSISWGAVYLDVWLSDIDVYLDKLHAQHQYAEHVEMSWVMLETIERWAPTSEATKICMVTGAVVGDLVKSLTGLKKDGDPLFYASTLQTSLKLISSTLLAQRNRFNYGTERPIGGDLCRLFSILVDEPDTLIESVGGYLLQIVKFSEELTPRQIKLVHIACRGLNSGHVDNTVGIVRLLLKFGANPDAVDDQGNGPLHHLAERNGELVDEAARLLLDAGAHLDRANERGLTAVDMWKKERVQKHMWRRLGCEDQLAVGWEDRPDWLQERNVPGLLCLSARVIRSHRIPYLEGTPVNLHPFIEMHKSN